MALRIGSTARATADRIGDVAAAGKIGEGRRGETNPRPRTGLEPYSCFSDWKICGIACPRVEPGRYASFITPGERKALMRELSDLGEITRDIRSLDFLTRRIKRARYILLLHGGEMEFEAGRTVREAGVQVDQGVVDLTVADFGRRRVVTGLANLHIVQRFVHDVGKSRLADGQSDQAWRSMRLPLGGGRLRFARTNGPSRTRRSGIDR